MLWRKRMIQELSSRTEGYTDGENPHLPAAVQMLSNRMSDSKRGKGWCEGNSRHCKNTW